MFQTKETLKHSNIDSDLTVTLIYGFGTDNTANGISAAVNLTHCTEKR